MTQGGDMRITVCTYVRMLVALFVIVSAILGWPMAVSTPHAQETAAPAKATIMVVFDGSGSMWGVLPGSSAPKFEAAREALKAAVDGQDGRINLGLTTFGLAARGGCEAAQVRIAPGATSPADSLAPLDSFNPKGRGPVVLGLQTALTALANVKGSRSIIVVHDDPDNCGGSICAMADRIRTAHPDISLHSLFIAPKPDDKGHMACLGKSGIGTAIEVAHADQLAAAAKKLVALSLPAPARASSAKPDARTPKQDPRLGGKPGVALTAVLGANASPLKDGVEWVIRDDKAAIVYDTRNGSGGMSPEPQPVVALAPGTYTVTATLGTLTQRETVTVTNRGKTAGVVNFEAGRLRFSAALRAGGAVVPGPVLTIHRLAPDGTVATPDKPFWLGVAGPTPLVLPAGLYRIDMQVGQLSRTRDITVTPDLSKHVEIPMDAGIIHVTVALREVSPQSPFAITVETDAPSTGSGRKTVARSASRTPVFTLPAGTYHISAEVDGVRAEDLVVLQAGDRISRTLHPDHMLLHIRPRLKGQSTKLDVPMQTTVWRLEGQRRRMVARSESAAPALRLGPGRYRVANMIGRQNARIVREFEVDQAGRGELVLEHDAGVATFSLDGSGSPENDGNQSEKKGTEPDIYWRVYDRSGTVVLRSTDRAPRAVLNVGTYVVVADVGTSQFRDTIVITAGQAISLKLRTQ